MRILFPGDEPVTVTYTFFKEQVKAKNVEAIYTRGDSITGRFAKPVTYPPPEDQDSKDGRTPRGVP